MRPPWILVSLLALSACENPAVLISDDLFRASAPEVIRSWAALVPWHPAQTTNLPAGGLPALEAAVKAARGARTFLVGAALSATDRATLSRDLPANRFVYFVPAAQAFGQATLAVDRSEAWAAVATRAGKTIPGPAVVFFPADATPEETKRFGQTWAASGGGPLEVRLPGSTAPWTPVPAQVFQWCGQPADASVLLLPPSVPVHGNPGTARVPGAQGLEWRLAEDGLGDRLWKAASQGGKKTEFLPVETVLVRR